MKLKIYQSALFIIAGVILISMAGCYPMKKIVYFQDKDTSVLNYTLDTTYVVRIQKNDFLSIYVTSLSEEASRYFNFVQRLGAVSTESSANDFLVDLKGNIQLPLIVNVHVEGLTSSEARDTITGLLKKYIINPSVKLNIKNFRVTVLGEVNSPGVFFVENEKMTIDQALSMAGDLTIYGKRENIMMIRETNGKKEFIILDLTARDFFSSPFYTMHANDILYVEPIKEKRFAIQNWYRIVPILFGAISATYVITKFVK